MIIKKEFYFVRHGQTDMNLNPHIKLDHEDVPLNSTGRAQASVIEPLVATLPVKTICHSPLKRVKETRDLACMNLSAGHSEIDELTECNREIWEVMTSLGKAARHYNFDPVHGFMQRVLKGINTALSHEGPVLIVAHGGVHWAACSLMDIEHHDWVIDNCIVTHFSINELGSWQAKKLNAL